MYKNISLNVLKPMLLVVKSKVNTKLEKETLKEIQKRENSYFNKVTNKDKVREYVKSTYYFTKLFDLIDDLEICCKNTGDVFLTTSELKLLNDIYEKDEL